MEAAQNQLKGAGSGTIALLVIFGIIMMIPATYPGFVYIRFFCDETEARLQKLPCAHISVMIFLGIACICAFAAGAYVLGV